MKEGAPPEPIHLRVRRKVWDNAARYLESVVGVRPDFKDAAEKLAESVGDYLDGASHMTPCGEFTGQIWKLVERGLGYFWLQTQYLEIQSYCLSAGDTDPNAKLSNMIQMVPCDDVGDQLWKIVPTN